MNIILNEKEDKLLTSKSCHVTQMSKMLKI